MKLKIFFTFFTLLFVVGATIHAMRPELYKTILRKVTAKMNINTEKPKPISLSQQDKIRTVIKDNLDQIENCYSMRIRDGLTQVGDLKVSWEIDEIGNALNVEEVKNNLRDSDLFECSSEMIASWKFPTSIYFKVDYTFHLKPKSETLDLRETASE